MRKILIIVCLLLIYWPAQAKLLYVNGSTGSDATTYANNDADHPWATLLRATWGTTSRTDSSVPLQAAQAGDTVYVAAGTYQTASYNSGCFGCAVLYEPANAGSAGNWITFEAVGTVTLTTTNPGVAQSDGAPVIGSTKSYIKWVGFTINQANVLFRRGNGMATSMADYVEFHNLTLVGAYTDYGQDDNHYGIMLHGDRSANGGLDCASGLVGQVIKNCSISGWTGTNGHNDAGIGVYCTEEFTIEHNEIYSNVVGIYFKTSWTFNNDQSYIRKNIIRNNTQTGIRMQPLDNVEVTQNIFRDNTGAAFHMHASDNNSSGEAHKDVEFVNNTIDDNGYVVYMEGDCSDFNGNMIRNNIATNITNPITNETAECQSSTYIGTADIDFDYNLYDHSGTFWSNEGGTVLSALSNFQSTFSQDTNSVDNVDPLYTNESGNDFTLTSSSPCREGEANDGVDILDLDGDSSTVDAITIGAYITGDEEIGIESGFGTTPNLSIEGRFSTGGN